MQKIRTFINLSPTCHPLLSFFLFSSLLLPHVSYFFPTYIAFSYRYTTFTPTYSFIHLIYLSITHSLSHTY
nr:MAG TPA: hypothetical protein [Bacteriophage sp.]